MKITVLTDNNTYIDQYFLGEPAVSYYIEIDSCKILFDTGYSDVFIQNAEKMGIDLSTLTHIVLSHGHNDHTGGLKFLSEKVDISRVKLICHPQCFEPKTLNGQCIGAPFNTQQIEKLCHYIPSAGSYKISESCTFLGQVPTLNSFEARYEIGTTIEKRKEIPDRIMDDSALVCKTKKGLFIITGCSHSGICNITGYAMQFFNNSKVYGILGGFHLFENNFRTQSTIGFLKSLNMQAIYPCHCVSLPVKCEMSKELNIKEVGVGLKIEI